MSVAFRNLGLDGPLVHPIGIGAMSFSDFYGATNEAESHAILSAAIDLVERHGIAYHEKKLGQLFCDHSAKDIIAMLTTECQDAGVDLALGTTVTSTAVTNPCR